MQANRRRAVLGPLAIALAMAAPWAHAADEAPDAMIDRLSGEVLSLPISPYMTDAEVAEVVAAVREFFAGSR